VTAESLIMFEKWCAKAFEAGRIRAPVHLSGGNEEQLIEIFKEIPRSAWVLSNWRSHYHALLHGIPEEKIMAQILAGKSMNLNFPEHRFMTSAIVAGCVPIAVGLAATGAEVWCFVGDMAASIGAFQDADLFARGHSIDVNWVIEDNGLSTNTPTGAAWGTPIWKPVRRYHYDRTTHHVGTGRYVAF
jgi:pyruvate dehydrogenase E1 component alpha subunit